MDANRLVCGWFLFLLKNPPVGEFSGEIKDWVHEVFTGKYVTSTSEESDRFDSAEHSEWNACRDDISSS